MTDTRIRTRPDGSIDTGFYMARGRHMRSEAAHRMMGHDTSAEKRQTPRARRSFFSL